MSIQLNVGKVVVGAFVVPWWNRLAFARALAVPLGLLVTLTLSWYYFGHHLSQLSNWALYLIYVFLFALFAVTCHRLVLLDPQAVASRMVPRWSWRETQFVFWMVAVWLIFAGVVFGSMTLILNLLMPSVSEPKRIWFEWTSYAAELPAFYVFARLCPLFPATAVDRKVSVRWAWRLTEKNGWRLVLIVGVLPWIISRAIDLLYRENATVVETIVLTFVGCALFAVEVAAISLSYRELTQGDIHAT